MILLLITLVITLVMGFVAFGLRVAWEVAKIWMIVIFGIYVFFLVGSCSPKKPRPEPPPITAELQLPARCQVYYNDGTGRWIECMGVGLK